MSEMETDLASPESEEGALTFGSIHFHTRNGLSSGTLKVSSSSVQWRPRQSGEVRPVNILVSDIAELGWTRIAKSFLLSFHLKSTGIMKFDGFQRQDFEPLSQFSEKVLSKPVNRLRINTSGQNWGDVELGEDGHLRFNVNGTPAFDLPYRSMVGTQLQPRTQEVSIECHLNDASVDEQLMELRLFVPGEGAAGILHRQLQQKADLGVATGDSVITLSQMPLLVPRGKYEIDMFPDFLRFHGKTHDYKVLYSNIKRLFKLPKPDQQGTAFIISLDTALRQGQTLYPHLIFMFTSQEDIRVPVHATTGMEGAPEVLQGPSVDVCAQAFRLLSGKKVTIPGTFRSSTGQFCVRCSMKANEGHLFLLERSLFFIYKPAISLRYDEITSIEITRANASISRNFDLRIDTRQSVSYQFTNLAREEYDAVRTFLREKRIPLRTDAGSAHMDELEGESEEESAASDAGTEEDSDFHAGVESDVSEEYDEGAGSGDEESSADEHERVKKKKRSDKVVPVVGKRKRSTGESHRERQKRRK